MTSDAAVDEDLNQRNERVDTEFVEDVKRGVPTLGEDLVHCMQCQSVISRKLERTDLG